MSTWVFSQRYSQPQRYSQSRWSWRSAGAAVSIAIHVGVLAWLLAVRAPQPAEMGPLNVSIINAAPPSEAPQQEIRIKPNLSAPTVAQLVKPEIELADTGPSNAITAVAASAPPSQSEAVAAPTQTQPIFDADYLNNPAPSYPALSRRLREEGVVYVRVYVSPDGLPERIELKTSSGSKRLDEAALLIVQKWRFVPARRGAQSVAAWVSVPIAFSLS